MAPVRYQTAEVDGFSAANVHQITSRFRRALREELAPG